MRAWALIAAALCAFTWLSEVYMDPVAPVGSELLSNPWVPYVRDGGRVSAAVDGFRLGVSECEALCEARIDTSFPYVSTAPLQVTARLHGADAEDGPTYLLVADRNDADLMLSADWVVATPTGDAYRAVLWPHPGTTQVGVRIARGGRIGDGDLDVSDISARRVEVVPAQRAFSVAVRVGWLAWFVGAARALWTRSARPRVFAFAVALALLGVGALLAPLPESAMTQAERAAERVATTGGMARPEPLVHVRLARALRVAAPSDELNHTALFFAASAVAFLCWPRAPLLQVVLGLLLAGGITEVLQWFTAARSPTADDLGWDTLGTGLALAARLGYRCVVRPGPRRANGRESRE